MANLLNKDPFTYEEERRSFLQDLQRFHQTRGTPYDRIPQIGGREVDLYRLYRRVIELGGFQKVNNEEKWDDIQAEFRVPRSCTNGAQALKFVYVRYLHIYEKINFLGQDPDRTDDDEGHPARKKLCTPAFGVALTYNYHHHNLTDAVRQTYNLSQNLVKYGDYDKLETSLLSGLPNEVDFVVNVCTLLSNESRHVLTLKKSNRLVNLLLAHIGVFQDGKSKSDAHDLENLYKYGWTVHSKRDYLRFWYESVQDKSTRELILFNGVPYERDKLCGEDVLNVNRDLGILDKEGQRVTQLAVLFRNLSFELANQEYLAGHTVLFKFLLLCIHCNYGTLTQLALDTLGNVAGKIQLKKLAEGNCNALLDVISRGLHSEDKFFVVRALEILGKLCQLESNESILSERLQSSAYEDVCRLLTIHDIQLIVHTLETMYQLSELGEQTTTQLAAVKCAVDMLVGLITVEAQSYGPNSLNGIKVVEYVPPPDPANKVSQGEGSSVSIVMQPPGTPVSKSTAVAAQNTPPRQPASADTKHNSDNESTTCNWLQATYENRRSGKVLQIDLLGEYLQFCRKYSVPEVLSPTDFMHLIKVVFPQAELTSKDKANGEKEMCIIGLSKRANPKPFAITHMVPKSRSVTSVNSLHGSPSRANPQVDLTQTPTLRQRLMEPPRIALHQHLVNAGPKTPGQKDSSRTPLSKSKSKTQQTLAARTLVSSVGTSTETSSLGTITPVKAKSVLQQQLQTPLAGNPSVSQTITQVVVTSVPPNVSTHSPQTFPTIHNALQTDAKTVVSNLNDLPLEVLQKSSDTNLIKSLLARKLSQNMVVRHTPTASSQTSEYLSSGNSTLDPNGTSVLATTEIFGQQQQADSTTSSDMVTHLEIAQHNNHNSDFSQPQAESPQPSPVHQVPLASPAPTTQQVSSSSQSQQASGTSPKIAKSKKGPGSPRPASPKAKSQNSSSSGSHPCSPRSASPRSQVGYELEVCGEVEKAKNIVRSGAEAYIERVENRNLQSWQKVQKSLPKPSTILMPTDSSDSIPSQLSTVEKSDLNFNSQEAKDFVSPSSGLEQNTSEAVDASSALTSVSEDVCFQNNVGETNDSVSDAKVSNSVDRLGINSAEVSTVSGNRDRTSEAVSTGPPMPVLNGSLNSPSNPDSDTPPSPVNSNNGAVQQTQLLTNGVGDDSEGNIDPVQKLLAKEQLLKFVEKTGKLNGIVNHVGNGDSVRDEEEMDTDANTLSKAGDEPSQALVGDQVRLQQGGNDSNSQGMNGNGACIKDNQNSTGSESKICVNVTVTKVDPETPVVTKTAQNIDDEKLRKQNHEKLEIPMGKTEQKLCDTRHVPTPETSRDSELSSDSFASSTAESVGDKHSTFNVSTSVGLSLKDGAAAKTVISTVLSPVTTATMIGTVITTTATKSSGKPKPRKRSRSTASNASTGSQESRPSIVVVPLVPEYMCEWNSCKKCFDSARSVFIHVSRTHVNADTNGMCQWLGCEQLKRKRWSLVTHCQDHHCSEQALRAAHQRRLTSAQTGQPPPAITTPTTMVYPNDAAMQAIRRFAPKSPFPEFNEPREGPVTKHIRLTAALILRNLARYSSLGRSLIKKRERCLSYQTMSAVESSTALANCLWEILHDT